MTMDQNPYASPLSSNNSAATDPEFRPTRAASWLSWAMRGGNGPAKRDPRTGEILLVVSVVPWGFSLFFILMVPTGLYLLTLADPPNPDEWWIPWLLGGASSALGVALLFSICVRVTASRDSIGVKKPFCSRQKLSWCDVNRVSFRNDGTVRLVSEDGTRLSIDSQLSGIIDFIDLLEKHLPAEVRSNCEADLEVYRRFVGTRR